jgi:hypothetical protein
MCVQAKRYTAATQIGDFCFIAANVRPRPEWMVDTPRILHENINILPGSRITTSVVLCSILVFPLPTTRA